MNKKVLKYIWILILFIALHISKIFAQQCYIYEGQRWQTGLVTYHINGNLGNAFATQEEYEFAIFTAAQTWNYAGANFEFIRGTNVYYARGEEPAGVFQVGKDYEFGGPLGWTDLDFNGSNEIIKACSYFNDYQFWSIDPDFTEYDIQSFILHEFGHWLRLLDETDYACQENVMYLGLYPGDTKRNLTQDDKNEIGFIYGQNPVAPLLINPLSSFFNRDHSFFEHDPDVLIYSRIILLLAEPVML
ncbi:MAG: matrixin family metalloprotease [Bacteroidetes bacterium]|nr:matrixin family metalloprotease [Bacteroidota bacterium]